MKGIAMDELYPHPADCSGCIESDYEDHSYTPDETERWLWFGDAENPIL